MALKQELFVPTSPSKFNFRPLSAGMVTTETSMAMPNGSFLEVNGYDISTRGPKKHGGWAPDLFTAGTLTPLQFVPNDPSERIESTTQLTLDLGVTVELVVTNRALYSMDETNGFKRLNFLQPFEVESATLLTGVTTIVVDGDFTDAGLLVTDTVIIDDVEYIPDTLVATATELTITITGSPTIVAEDLFHIFKPFAASDSQFVDFTSSRNKMYFVDGSTRMVWSFDGVEGLDGALYLQPHIIVGTGGERTVMGASSITAFNERLYFLGILEEESDGGSGLYYTVRRNRVRWTEVLNHKSCLAASYQDLARSSGVPVKILGMGALIMAYMSDGIFYGRSTNLSSIPYAFTFIETAGITALGSKAISTYFDGQIFLGTDNLYFISTDAQITSLGKKVSDTLKDRSGIAFMSCVLMDTLRSRIMIATSNSETEYECLFFYNYRSEGWSINDSLHFLAPAVISNNAYLYYKSVPDDDLNQYGNTPLFGQTYESLLEGRGTGELYCFINGYFMKYDGEQGLNQLVVNGSIVPSPSPSEIITPDFDFDDPDTDKTALRVSLKITEKDADARTENLYFMVSGSRDRGATWKPLGRMRIRPGYDEDALNFRLMGSTLRFRFRHGRSDDATSTDVIPFTISEVVLRLRERAIEAQRSNSRE